MLLRHSRSSSRICVGGSNTVLSRGDNRRVPLCGSISQVVCHCSSSKVFCRGGSRRVLRYRSST